MGKDPCNPPESGPWMPYGKHLTATTISTSSTHMLPEPVWGAGNSTWRYCPILPLLQGHGSFPLAFCHDLS